MTVAFCAALAGCVAAVAVAVRRDEPKPYDVAATRACLSSIARVSVIPRGRGYWLLPGLSVNFPGSKPSDEWAIYFGASVSDAKSQEMPDSDVMLRRRNVLAERIAQFERWDRRILRCLRVRSQRS